MTKLVSLIVSLVFVVSTFFQNLAYFFTPTVEFDLKKTKGEFTHGACGYLYGLAEEGVPSKEVVKSLDIKSASQKLMDGMQHPIGDVDHVSGNLESTDYTIVYLQDSYDTWYYAYDEIIAMRDRGGYDCEAFVNDDFLPRVREAVEKLSKKDYAHKLVYCLYNECDNAVWFGTRHDDGWLEFDDAAKLRFYKAFKAAYDTVKSIDPDALIGGPGYCDYNIEKLSGFLEYCRDNNCMPDVMIYHELNPASSMWWEDHVKEYRQKEEELGISALPVIVTEYGTMEECGQPSDMIHYIRAIENSGTYGNIAYWRLSDNLCDTCAYANIPNSQWWLYKWYCDMRGQRIEGEINDITHSDVANVIKYRRESYHLSKLEGIGNYDTEKKSAEFLCVGSDYDFQIAVKNAKLIGRKLRIKIEAVTFEGLSGEVLAPAVIDEYNAKASGTLKISMNGTDKYAVYRVTVSEDDGSEIKSQKVALPERFEFESGMLLGTAYTYDSAYATTGETAGMCGGFEHEGDGISLDFTVPESGKYELAIVYGKANDGPSSADRKDAEIILKLDGKEEKISVHNTIKSEYTDKYVFKAELESGSHNITLMHSQGTFVADSLLVRKEAVKEVYCEYCQQYGEHLIIAPHDGFYTSGDGKARYLKYGLNFVKPDTDKNVTVNSVDIENLLTVKAEELSLEGGAVLNTGDISYINGINSEGGSASFTVNAPESGLYAVTVKYSNNGEDGVHAYNVDITEEYITITAGNEKTNLWCTNTYSAGTFRTAVAYINLDAGENTVTLSNDGHCRFAGKTATSPDIAEITVNPAVADI